MNLSKIAFHFKELSDEDLCLRYRQNEKKIKKLVYPHNIDIVVSCPSQFRDEFLDELQALLELKEMLLMRLQERRISEPQV